MLGAAEPTELTRQNVQARLRGRACGTGPTPRAPVPPDRQHEREGGRLHHHRRRPRRRAVGDRQRAEDRGHCAARAAAPALRLRGIADDAGHRPGPELADAQAAEDELMPFPVLDACLHLYAGEKMSPDEVAQALVAFPRRRATRRTRGRPASPRSSPARSTSGCSRRWRCTWARSTSTASARCSCRWSSKPSGPTPAPLARRRDDASPCREACKVEQGHQVHASGLIEARTLTRPADLPDLPHQPYQPYLPLIRLCR